MLRLPPSLSRQQYLVELQTARPFVSRLVLTPFAPPCYCSSRSAPLSKVDCDLPTPCYSESVPWGELGATLTSYWGNYLFLFPSRQVMGGNDK